MLTSGFAGYSEWLIHADGRTIRVWRISAGEAVAHGLAGKGSRLACAAPDPGGVNGTAIKAG